MTEVNFVKKHFRINKVVFFLFNFISKSENKLNVLSCIWWEICPGCCDVAQESGWQMHFLCHLHFLSLLSALVIYSICGHDFSQRWFHIQYHHSEMSEMKASDFIGIQLKHWRFYKTLFSVLTKIISVLTGNLPSFQHTHWNKHLLMAPPIKYVQSKKKKHTWARAESWGHNRNKHWHGRGDCLLSHLHYHSSTSQPTCFQE